MKSKAHLYQFVYDCIDYTQMGEKQTNTSVTITFNDNNKREDRDKRSN